MTLPSHLAPTDNCLSPERLGETLTFDERAHVAECPRCRAELTLFREFSDGDPRPGEGAAVAWIAAELRRRQSPQPAARTAPRRWPFGLGRGALLATGAAAALVLAAVAYLVPGQAPEVRGLPPGVQVYRAPTVDLLTPVGDLPSAPAELSWKPVEGAVRYDVSLLEVDRTPLWSASSPSPRLPLPAMVTEQMVPGKTLLWDVTAIDGSGRPIAASGNQRFRVVGGVPPGRP